MAMGELLGSGRSADVFAIDDQWVLRRYRDGGDTTAEAVVMSYVAEHGFPVPRVRTAAGPELVLQRLSGPSLLAALQDGTTTTEAAGAILADLLGRLHAVPARDAAGPARPWLHLDLHPDNVVLTPDGPVLIDWRNAEEGPPALDWAMSALILAQVAVAPDDRAVMVRDVLTSMLRRRDPQIRWGDSVSGCLAEARLRRAADPNLTNDEADLLDEAVTLVLEVESANTR